MKKRVRKRLSPKALEAESKCVTMFVLTRIIPDSQSRGLALADVFQAYTKWKRREFGQPTPLSIDGFGRLFPKNFCRKGMSHGGVILKSVVGVRLV